MNKHLVFVYGSLKQGFGNHHFLRTATLLEATRTGSRAFRMESMGGFPAVVKNGSYAIEGELYEVDDETLRNLDRLEGNGRFYNRELVFLSSGHTAWMYLLMPSDNRFGARQFASNVRVKNTRNHTQRWLQEQQWVRPSNYGNGYQSTSRSATLA
jgi:gamma-glutamylaminecyclotransferase